MGGSGVVYKLVQGIIKRINQALDSSGRGGSLGIAPPKAGLEKWYLDMVGLATMADMVPLQGENRVFAHYGLRVLRKTPRLGLRKLIEKSKLRQTDICEDDIGFTIAPRINAASRMGDPVQAFQLLTATDDATAETLSNHLNKINDERKGLAGVITKEIKRQIKKRAESETMKKVLVVGNPDWKPPLLGPVASNLSDEFGVPVFLWGRSDGELIKGSCRSDGRVNLVELMSKTPEGTFAGFGGHKMSGGFSVNHENIHLLEEALCKAYEHLEKEVPKTEDVFIDGKLTLNDVNWVVYESIAQLAPFGTGNEKPVFLFEGITIDEVKLFGKEKNHLELIFRNSQGKKVSAIGFFTTVDSYDKKIARGEKINLIATLEKSTFRNFPELRLRIVDVV